MKKIGMISLGCAKNQVDSEMILGMLRKAGYEIVASELDADLIIINTCGFIEAARLEAIETINEVNSLRNKKQKMIVCGCYAKRYKEKLLKEMPFIDAVISLDDYDKFLDIVSQVLSDDLSPLSLNYHERVYIAPSYSPYVKISDGCNNRCTYCAIPLIRGNFRSREMDDIILECKELAALGAREINLISQDTTRYGSDLNNGVSLLPELITEVAKIENVEFVRILYMYPDLVSDKLIETIKNNPKVVPYFDIPIQHASDHMLTRMNRRGSHDYLLDLFKKIKENIPHAILRTTLIVGFPGETLEDFEILRSFVKEVEFDRLGCFTYSKEEDTASYYFTDQIPEDIKEARYNEIMAIQNKISYKRNRLHLGKTYKAIVEFMEEETGNYYLRNYAFAPDEIDGYIVAENNMELHPGDVVLVKIVSAFTYDLFGDIIEKL